MEHYLGVAKDHGVSQNEIDAVQGICMAVSAGRVNAQLKAIEKKSVRHLFLRESKEWKI